MGFYSFETGRSEQVQVVSVPGSGWLCVTVATNPWGMFDPSERQWIDPSKEIRNEPSQGQGYAEEVEKRLLAIDQARRQFVAHQNLKPKP